MTMPNTEEKAVSAWELESGLVNDVDAWIKSASFGTKKEYLESLTTVPDSEEAEGTKGLMIFLDLIDEAGEPVGQATYTVGTGWTASSDGMSMSHPKRKNVVRNTRYGMFQERVISKLKVDMEARGLPLDANSWVGLGFHWMLEKVANNIANATKKENDVLFPTIVLAEMQPSEAAAGVTAGKAVAELVIDAATNTELQKLVKANPTVQKFVIAAMKLKAVLANSELMNHVLDDSANGYHAKHK